MKARRVRQRPPFFIGVILSGDKSGLVARRDKQRDVLVAGNVPELAEIRHHQAYWGVGHGLHVHVAVVIGKACRHDLVGPNRDQAHRHAVHAFVGVHHMVIVLVVGDEQRNGHDLRG